MTDQNLVPVSYTHLDVYKRQAYKRVNVYKHCQRIVSKQTLYVQLLNQEFHLSWYVRLHCLRPASTGL